MKKVFYLSGLLALSFALCSVVSKAAIPHVYFTSTPGNDTVCSGLYARFSVAANDTTSSTTPPISFQWQVSTDGGTSWTDATDPAIYFGNTTDSLVVVATLPMNGYKFRCVATDTNGSSTSPSGLLTVIGIAPGTISGPSSVCRTSSITLSDSVTGGTWSVSSTSIATITSGGVLTGHAQGYDTVKYTDTNACGSGETIFVVRVDTAVSARAISGPTVTCVGHTIVLTNPNVLGTWTWSTSNGNATVSHAGGVTGVSYGMDTIYYVFTNACSTVTSSYVVGIDTVLNAGAISGATELCAGSWIHLSETVAGGSWLSSNSAIATVDASGNVTGVDQGIVTISYYLSNACGTSAVTHIDTVSRPASMIAGLDSVGVGLTRLLSDTVSGGTWSTSDTTITIDTATGLVTGVTVGTATVTYTVTNFCGTTSATIIIHVGNPPASATISGPTSVCLGSTATLTPSVTGGVWSVVNDTFASVNSAGVVRGLAVDSGQASAIDTVIYTYTTGFGSATTLYPITVLHTPIISFTGTAVTYSVGQNYLIKGSPAGGTWSHTNHTTAAFIGISDSVVAGTDYGTVLSYMMLRPGKDTLSYRVTNACGTADSFIYISIASVGVPMNNQEFSINVYPNPSQGAFTMNIAGSTMEQAQVTITNIVGEKVQELTVPTNKLVDVKFDQPAGVYLLTAATSTGKYTVRISVTK